jgi:hypothetical protein
MSTATAVNTAPATPTVAILSKMDEYAEANKAVLAAHSALSAGVDDAKLNSLTEAIQSKMAKRHEVERLLNRFLKVSNPDSVQAQVTNRDNFLLIDVFGISTGKLQPGASKIVIGGLAAFAGLPGNAEEAGKTLKSLCKGSTDRTSLWTKLINLRSKIIAKDAGHENLVEEEDLEQAESELIDEGLRLVSGSGLKLKETAPKDHAEAVKALEAAKAKS